MPSRRSPRVMSWYSAKAFKILSRRFSMRTPVWTRSTRSFGSSAMCTNVPNCIGNHNTFRCPLRPFLLGRMEAPSKPADVPAAVILRLRLTSYSRSCASLRMTGGQQCRLVIIAVPSFDQERILLAFDEDVYELRRQKLKQIEALGQTAYRSKYDFTHTIPQILAEYTDKTAEQLENPRISVRVAGRIMAIRLMGKAGFCHLQQDGKRLQIYVKKDAVGDQGFELYKLLDLGDHIGVSGYLFRTRTGRLTIHVEEVTFLSKDLLPLPEKWHGLTDVELRYRQRYVDLVMNPEVREVFLKRSKLVQSLRRFMDAQGFVEVETPMMQPIAGGAVARPFVTHHNTLDIDLYLRIAPELYLKRLTVGGFDQVYEINRNFRNEGLGWRWNPEFTMLEFYQAYTDYRGVMDLTQQLIEQAAKDVTGGTKAKWGEEEIDWAASNWRRMTMREAIVQHWPEAAGAKPEMPEFASPEGVEGLVRRFNSAHAHIAYDPGEPTGKTIANLFDGVAE